MNHSHTVIVLVLALAGGTLTGCPRTPEAPDLPTGTPCEQLSDCNPGVACGSLTLCVDGYCEGGRSLLRPCPGAGDRVRSPDS